MSAMASWVSTPSARTRPTQAWCPNRPSRPCIAGGSPISPFDGLPVISRFHLRENCRASRRSFGRSSISRWWPTGITRISRTGFGILEECSQLVNSFGECSWRSLDGIAQSNYRTRIEDGILHVQPYSRRIRVTSTADTQAIAVQLPAGSGDPRHSRIHWRQVGMQ